MYSKKQILESFECVIRAVCLAALNFFSFSFVCLYISLVVVINLLGIEIVFHCGDLNTVSKSLFCVLFDISAFNPLMRACVRECMQPFLM